MKLLLFASVMISGISFAQEVPVDDIHLRTLENRHYGYAIKKSDIKERTIGASFSSEQHHGGNRTLRVICTDVEIESCDKYRFIESSNHPSFQEEEVFVHVLTRDYLTHNEIETIMQKIADHLGQKKLKKDEILETMLPASQASLYLTFIAPPAVFVAFPIGIAIDIISSPFNLGRLLYGRKKYKMRTREIIESLEDAKSVNFKVESYIFSEIRNKLDLAMKEVLQVD